MCLWVECCCLLVLWFLWLVDLRFGLVAAASWL